MIITWSIIVIVIFMLSRLDLVWSRSTYSLQKFLGSTKSTFDVPRIAASTDKVIIVQDVELAYIPKILHELDFDAAVASFEFDYDEKLLFFSTYSEIYRKDLQTEKVQKIFPENGNTSGKFEMVKFSLDWLNNDLYFLADLQGYTTFNIYKIDFDGKKQDVVYSTHYNRIEHFQVDPYNGFLFWTSVQGFHRADLINVRKTKEVIFNDSFLSAFVIDHVNYRAFIIDDAHHYLISVSLDGSQRKMERAENVVRTGLRNAPSLALLYNKFYWTDNSEVMYEEYDEKNHKYYHNQLFIRCDSCSFFSYVLAYTPTRQPVPYPLNPPESVTVTNVTDNGIHLSWKEPDFTDGKGKGAWRKYLYRVQYMNLNTSKTYSTFDIKATSYVLEYFVKNCTYEIKVLAYTSSGESLWSNGIVIIASPFVYSELQTNVVNELTPTHVKVENLTPILIKIKWLPPFLSKHQRIWYEINWKNNQSDVDFKQKIVVDNSMRFENDYLVSKLSVLSNQTYYFWVRAHSNDNIMYSDSDVVTVNTYKNPKRLELLNRTYNTLVLKWLKSNEIVDFIFEYSTIPNLKWKPIENVNITNGTLQDVITLTVSNLKPKSEYQFRGKLSYQKDVNNQFIWPKIEPYFTFETLAGVPSETPPPNVRYVDEMYLIEWRGPTTDNGAPVLYFLLEMHDLKTATTDSWTVICNTTIFYCKVKMLPKSSSFIFRVRACNAAGVGEYGRFSKLVANLDTETPLPHVVERKFEFTATQYLCFLAVVVFVSVSLIFLYVSVELYKSRTNPVSETNNLVTFSTQQASSNNAAISPDATVIELEENVVVDENLLPTPSQNDINQLPQFNQNDLILIQLLGQGAFGDVYAGEIKNKQKVAIKMLRSDLDARKRDSFLSEAILMSKFNHKHVLQFLGICLVDRKYYIVMELMENGDLLTYLRASRTENIFSRPYSNHGTSLSSLDMTNLCVQICLGCQYLERRKYIHRDLACRNCLVAIRNTEVLVKIADFGLTRTIRDKNYYRVQNEHRLPVRWMAPESLNDNIYTTQSDVWSFGVVMWEVFTVGDEPYSELDALDVIDYIKSGNTLWAPSYCPVDAYRLMKMCWHYNYRNRASFKYCFDELSQLKASLMGHNYTNLIGFENDYLAVLPENHRKIKINTVENKTYIMGSENYRNGVPKVCKPSSMPVISEEP